MKALKYFASALALVALFTACEEESEYQPAQLPDTQEAYFPATTMTVSMEELANGFEVELARINYDEAATATLKSERPEGVNVPSSVSFNAGQEKTTFTVSVDQAALGEGKTFKIVMNVDSESNSPYANQRCTVTLTTWSPTPPATWRPIETKAVVAEETHPYLGLFGYADKWTFPVYVEKLDGQEVYRVANLLTGYVDDNGTVYKHPAYGVYYGSNHLVDPEAVIYTYFDLSGYMFGSALPANLVYIPVSNMNFDLGYGDPLWGTIGGNMSGYAIDNTTMGVWDAATKSIKIEARATIVQDSDGAFYGPAKFTLFLDENLAGTNFERDCAFSKLQDATYNSSILEDKWTVALYEGVPSDEKKAAEYAEKFGQVIKVENAYVQGFPLYFCVDAEGKISVPEEYASQAMGLSIAGFDLYLNIKKGEFANNSYTILGEMVGVDPTGVKADVIYGEYTEVINAEVIGAASSIDDFVGDFVMSATTFEFDEQGRMTGNLIPLELAISMVKVDDETVKMIGITGGVFEDYDDSLVWTYNGGYLQFTVQDMPNLYAGSTEYDVFATLCTTEGNLYNMNAAGVLFYNAGVSSTGNIKFFNDPVNAQNDVEADGIGVFGVANGSYTIITDPIFEPTMTAASAAARTEYVTKARFAPVVGSVITKLTRKSAEREYVINGQKAQVKSKGKVTPTLRHVGNAVEVTLR